MSGRKHSALGWILVLIGALLLFNHWYPYPRGWIPIVLNWTTVLMAIGVGFFLAGIFHRDRGAVFPGTFLFLIGLLFFLNDQDLILLPWWRLWPLFPLFLGVAFINLCIFDPGRKRALFPGIFLIIFAFIFLLLPGSWNELFYWAGKLWPIVLIIIGLHILWKSFQREKTKD